MKAFVLNFLTYLHTDEAGQGLVEYMLILALVGFVCAAGMRSLAGDLNLAFSDIGSLIDAYIT
jgi:Flp pilus assembly pilin Flp